MTSSWKRHIPRPRLAVALVLGALAFAVPVSGASAAAWPGFFGGSATPFAFAFPAGGIVLSGTPEAGNVTAGCADSRPSVVSSGSATAKACYSILAFIGPTTGSISSQVGPTIIGSVILAPVIVSAGSVLNSAP